MHVTPQDHIALYKDAHGSVGSIRGMPHASSWETSLERKKEEEGGSKRRRG